MFGGISFENTMLVTLAGIVIVFLVLFLLIMIITLFGKAFGGGKKSKSEPVPAKKEAVKAQAGRPFEQSHEDEDELVAVITAAALSALSGDGKKYAVRSVRPAKNFGVRSPWQAAGLADNMRPF